MELSPYDGLPADLPLSAALAARVDDWVEAWCDAAMDRFAWPAEAEHAWRVAGFRLAADLQAELGPGVLVVHPAGARPRPAEVRLTPGAAWTASPTRPDG